MLRGKEEIELQIEVDRLQREVKDLKEKAEAWDIAWPALIFLDATGNLDDSLAWNSTLKRAVKHYNERKTES